MQQDNLTSAAYYCAAQKIFGDRPFIGIAAIEHFGGAANLFSLPDKDLNRLSRLVPECKNISPEIVQVSYNELETLKSRKISFVSYIDRTYPDLLKSIYSFPIGIYIQTSGDADKLLSSTKLLGVVGGKNPYSYGVKSCKAIIDSIEEMQTGSGIITRMTSGIELTADNLAVSHGIPSIGVLPYGFSKSPGARDQTIENMPSSALITDIQPGGRMSRSTQLRRSRIISALSRAVILVESSLTDSCHQIIDNAFSYGKEIWAFPGPVHWTGYMYNNKMIRLNIAEAISSYDDLKDKIKRL